MSQGPLQGLFFAFYTIQETGDWIKVKRSPSQELSEKG